MYSTLLLLIVIQFTYFKSKKIQIKEVEDQESISTSG